MQPAVFKINNLLENLEQEDYDKVVSYIEFLVNARKKERTERERIPEDKASVEEIVASLIGAIPDSGKTLEEYRDERLKKYEEMKIF